MKRPLNYVVWHCLRVFFENLEEWRGLAPLVGIESTLTQQKYDDLFKGTNADLFIPVWASCAKSGSKLLLDETTLDVIKAYKEIGYSWIDMDGNPPDYIGQQFRFLEYLSICDVGESDAAARFIENFTMDTARAMREALLAATEHAEILSICSLMADALSGKEIPTFASDLQVSAFDSQKWEKGNPLSIEPIHIKKIASFNDCGAKCLMQAVVQEGCVLGTQPDTSVMPFTGCARGRAYRQTFLMADRLRYPMERIGKRGEGRFRRITWEYAAEKIASEIIRCGKEYGPGSRYVTPASGVSALVRGDRFMKRLLGLSGGFLEYYNYYSAACANYTVPYVYGTIECGHSQEDVLNTKLLILWGHNPAENHFGPFQNKILAQLKEKGVPIIVIDPRKSESVLTYADEWIPIKPSTDSALVDAMCWWIISNGLQDQEFMDRFCLGFDEDHMPEGIPANESYHAYLFGKKDGVEKTAEWAESVTGIPSETIIKLASAYASSKPACVMPGLGPQRTMNGEQFYRSMTALCCVTGNVGKTGGSSGGTPWTPARLQPDFTAYENGFPGSIPSFLWTKAVDSAQTIQPGKDGLLGVERLDSGIKAMFNLANGLLLTQHSDINQTCEILRDENQLEFLVVSDLFMTSGARFADILLPAPSFFEMENIVPPWVPDDYVLFNQKSIDALFGARFEYDWIKEVASNMGLAKEFTDGKNNAEAWIEALYNDARSAEPELPALSELKSAGCFAYQKAENFIAFKDLIDSGGTFPTPSGKIEIFSKALYDMGNPEKIPGLPRYVACCEGPGDALKEKYPLQLIGYHTKRRCHSIHDNNPLMEELDAPALWMNGSDAEKRNIQPGGMVEIYNKRGRVQIPVKITERIMQGVVAISEGGWYHPDQEGVDHRGCINVLTSHEPTPLAKGNPQHTNLVEVKAVK